MSTYKIVLVRHGESEWNLVNKFCGWHDADLSDKGIEEAKQAGKVFLSFIIDYFNWIKNAESSLIWFKWLKESGFKFDLAFTSVLKRAIKTLFLIQDELDLHWIPVVRTWRLNERMYGGLQGLNKAETAARHGEAQVKVKNWPRFYSFSSSKIMQFNASLDLA